VKSVSRSDGAGQQCVDPVVVEDAHEVRGRGPPGDADGNHGHEEWYNPP